MSNDVHGFGAAHEEMVADSSDFEPFIAEYTFANINSIHVGRFDTPNLHLLPKKIANAVSALSGVACTAAPAAMGEAGLATAIITGAAMSATGIGFAVAGAAITVGGIGLSGRSLYRTHQHIKNLESLRLRNFRCDGHPAIHDQCLRVLDYIVKKKKAKRVTKGFGTAGLSLFTKGYQGGKALYKWKKGTKGRSRNFAAQWLDLHLVSCNCELAQAIVAELFRSQEIMQALMILDTDTGAPFLAEKMKSS